MICTVYSHHTGFDKILDIIKDIFPKANVVVENDEESQIAQIEIPGSFFKSTQKIVITYRQRAVLSAEILDVDDSPLTLNIRGLYGYVSSLPAKNENVRALFLKKIRTINSEFSIQQQQGSTKELKYFIQTLAERFDAILFVQPDTVISKSSGQHFLDKNLDLIIDRYGNCAINTLTIKIDIAYIDNDRQPATPEQNARKAKSERVLNARGIKINSNLPCIESAGETKIRTPKEIAERIVALAVTNMVAFDSITNDEAIDYLEEYGLWKTVSADEKVFLADPTPEAKNQETWKCESIWVLMWAINEVDELGFPDTMCDLSDIPYDEYPVGPGKNPHDFIDRIAESRLASEILDTNDLYYRFHWACVDARINNRFMEELNPGVVYERHYALNWLINYMDQEWDDVSCDT